jgi:hypothetical protein
MRAMKQRQIFRTGFATVFVSVAMLFFAYVALAQNADTFKARLSPVPIDIAMQSTVAGVGSLTAKLTGTQLTIAGTFEGLRSPATTAQIHSGPKGIPGPPIMDITVAKSVKGAISGSLTLTPDQIADLKSGRLYVQIQSERAPDGNLWGWLLQ